MSGNLGKWATDMKNNGLYDTEKYLEPYLMNQVKRKGALCLKFVSPGNRGVPDRMILVMGARVDFVEVKTKGEEPGKLQLWWHNRLRNLGFRVEVIDTKEKADEYLNSL